MSLRDYCFFVSDYKKLCFHYNIIYLASLNLSNFFLILQWCLKFVSINIYKKLEKFILPPTTLTLWVLNNTFITILLSLTKTGDVRKETCRWESRCIGRVNTRKSLNGFCFFWISSGPVIIKGLDPGDVTCGKH